MTKYDAIVILGTQPDTSTWEMPEQIYDCLDKTKQLFENKTAPMIVTCGKWSLAVEAANLRQPFRECDAMAEYLIEQGIPDKSILREGYSKDTISNLYYLKTHYLIPNNLKKLVFVVAGFRIPRLQALCEHILGSEYEVSFESILCAVGPSYNEDHTIKIQKEFLSPMKPGDHTWLADKFYDSPMYQFWKTYNQEHSLIPDFEEAAI